MASHVIDSTGSSVFAHIAHAWHGFAERQAAARIVRAQKRKVALELSTYTDRELWDLGISRDNIPDIVAGTFHRA